MTGTTDRYGFYQTDHRKFGGMIHPSDYNTTYANKNTASRIESDRKFDEQCRKNTLRQKQLHKEDLLQKKNLHEENLLQKENLHKENVLHKETLLHKKTLLHKENHLTISGGKCNA